MVEPDQIGAWISAGADALMFTFGVPQSRDWGRITDAVRRAEVSQSRPVAFILDLPDDSRADHLLNSDLMNQIHMIAVSADRGGAGIRSLRDSFIGARDLDIVAKFDSPACFADAEAIIQSADAVIVSLEGLRSLNPSEAPVAQKQVSRRCQAAAIPCFVERDSFRRLSSSPNQHQADIFDLANIVFDHADGVLLNADDFDNPDLHPPMEPSRVSWSLRKPIWKSPIALFASDSDSLPTPRHWRMPFDTF
jgi:pyruvate kinase